MSAEPAAPSRMNFVKIFLLPALWVFLIPTVTYLFFNRAEARLDQELRPLFIERVQQDEDLDPKQRQQWMQLLEKIPASQMVLVPELARLMSKEINTRYMWFRWMMRIAVASLASGIAVMALGGVCLLLSRRSPRMTYLTLAIGWRVLQVFAALQTILQGGMVVALSFWVPAVFFNIYIVKLIAVAGLFALAAVGSVIWAIFQRPTSDFAIEGKVLQRADSPRLWEGLEQVCQKVGTALPKQVVVGIDDNFFVTEMPVNVGHEKYSGRTLFVSLSLIKQLNGSEVDAVLAHEMAHLSGGDTLFTKKIHPLLAKYGVYLHALYQQTLGRPVYHFLNAFRALFELSLRENDREREFRADKIAAQTTSPLDIASALMRIIAYSTYRQGIQQELFSEEKMLGTVGLQSRVSNGFQEFAQSFYRRDDLGRAASSHPFDTHPPLAHRLEAVELSLDSWTLRDRIAEPGDGQWANRIEHAEEIEREQWSNYESLFLDAHNQSLPFRYLPETEEEAAIIEQHFPPLAFESGENVVHLSYHALESTSWEDKLLLEEVEAVQISDGGQLVFTMVRGGRGYVLNLDTNPFGDGRDQMIQAIAAYCHRSISARAYQTQKRAAMLEKTNSESRAILVNEETNRTSQQASAK